MKYKVSMSDSVKDESIVKYVEANDVFDAINIASTLIEHPDETELVEAIPCLNNEDDM